MLDINLEPILKEISDKRSGNALVFSKLVWAKYIKARSIKEFHQIQTGIRKGDKIPLGKKGNNYGYMPSDVNLESGCDYNECSVDVTFSTKLWDTHRYSCKVSICLSDLKQEFEDFWELNCGDKDLKSEADLNNAFIDFLVNYQTEALVASHWTKVWFANSTVSKDSLLHGADGIFTRALAIAPVKSTQRITIEENSNGTYAEQLELDPQRGYEVFKELRKRALKSRTLRGRKKDLVIYATEDLIFSYQDYLERNNQEKCCYKSDVTVENYESLNLNIYGIKIVPMTEWDDIIQGTDKNGDAIFSELNNGTKYTDPHRAIISYKDNFPVGTCNADSLEDVRLHFNEDTERFSIKSRLEMGANITVDTDFILAM